MNVINVMKLVLYFGLGAITHRIAVAPIHKAQIEEGRFSKKSIAYASWIIGFLWIPLWPLWFVAILVIGLGLAIEDLIRGGRS